MPELQPTDLESALAALEAAKAEGKLPDELQGRLDALATTRADLGETLTKTRKSRTKTPAKPRAKAPATSHRVPAVISSASAEVRELAEALGIEEGYEKAMATQRYFELVKPRQKVPSYGQVIRAFTPEMLIAAKGFSGHRLVLETKGISFDGLVSAVDVHKINPNQYDTGVAEIYRQHADRKAENWGAYIVGNPIKFRDGLSDWNVTLEDRLRDFEEYKRTHGVGANGPH